jgi:hypothetical protein
MPRDENTIRFELWPNMIMVEGPAADIGELILAALKDESIAGESWTVSHKMASRREFALEFMKQGSEKRRLGIGITRPDTVQQIQAHAKRLGLSTFLFNSPRRAAD